MKIGLLTCSLSRDAGGIFEIETALVRELSRLGYHVSPLGTRDKFTALDEPAWAPTKPRHFRYFGNPSYRFSPGLQRAFLKEDFDICHLSSLWNHTSLIGQRWRKKTGRPCLISPNGMLDPWAMKHSAWKKRIVYFLYEKKGLMNCSCLHANTEKEASDFRRLGLKNPIAIIPNGVYLPDLCSDHFSRGEKWDGEKKLLYLGRIHPKKGLANALVAWGKLRDLLRRHRWKFIIAGWDQNGHLNELQRLCEQLGLKYRTSARSVTATEESCDICFTGPAFGPEKKKLLIDADMFILPSFSEGMPMAVLEAWAHGLPVMMTQECNLNIGFEHAAAIPVNATSDSIAEGFRYMVNLTSQECERMGLNGRTLVDMQFSWRNAATELANVYNWLCRGGSVPASVVN